MTLTPSATNAARWLASIDEAPHPVIPSLRDRFGLSPSEAIAAIREANRLRGERKHISTPGQNDG